MTDPTTPQAIAACLTEPQKAALLWLPADGSERAVEHTSQIWIDFWVMVSLSITDDIDVSLVQRSSQIGHDNHWFATPLGRRVREEIARILEVHND